jgi:phosphoglycerate dehydrogenase-like enzyme
MNATARSVEPMRVLFTGSRTASNWEPWGREMFTELGRSHDVRMVDPYRPLANQVADPEVHVVVDASFLATPEVIAAAEGHVRLWQLGSVGYDKLDMAAFVRHGIPVANQPGISSSRSLAEHALMLAMLVQRDYHGMTAAVEAATIGVPTGRQLAGRSLLIIGLGASGKELAKRATAFGMRVHAVTRSGPDEATERRFGLASLRGMDALDDALTQADVVSLHVPLSPETRTILDARRLRLIRQGGVVVNVSRGGLIDEAALVEAVRDGHLYGAGLDVVDGEPAQPGNPILGVPNIYVLPHVAGATDSTAHRRARFAAMNVSRLARGLEPLCRVDHLPPQG